MFLSSRVHLVNPGLTIFNMMDRESQSMAAALTVKAASETLVRFFLAMLDAWGRSDVKVLLRSDQDGNREHWLSVRWLRATRPWGAMERANRTMGEMLRTMKHATETRIGGRLETDHPLISWMIRHCCWVFCRYHVRADGRTPYEVLRNNSYRGGLACFGEIVWARVPGSRLLRGKYEVNWLELVWLGKTENTEEHRRGCGGCSPRRPAGERRVLPVVEGTLWQAAALHESTQNARMEREQGNAWILSPQRPCRNVRVLRRRLYGRR